MVQTDGDELMEVREQMGLINHPGRIQGDDFRNHEKHSLEDRVPGKAFGAQGLP